MIGERTKLAVFDMDNTICDSFVEICFFMKYSEAEREAAYNAHPADWAKEVLKAYESHRIGMSDVENILRRIDMVQGITNVFDKLKADGFDLIVMSGANDLLCRKFLEIRGVDHYFQDFIANPMTYDETTDSFHYIVEESIDCKVPLCGMRICKKSKLDAYLKKYPQYQTVYFFGDGTNDLCGMSLIPQGKGKAFIRKYYSLFDMVTNDKKLRNHIQAEVKYWTDGRDLAEKL